jgi:dipeptidyl aminopeptidase/acylaminoacyl peptidase
VLIDGADQLAEPSWSADNALMMTVARAPRAELRLLNADGSSPRALQVPESFVVGTAWSPDGKWIAYTGFADSPPPHVAAIDVATGRVQKLYDLGADESVAMRWMADSRGLILVDTFQRPPENRRVVFRAVDLTGKMTVLREIPLGPAPSGAIAVDESTALVMQNAQAGYRVVRLTGDTPDRELPLRSSDSSPLMVTPDGQWAVARRAPSPGSGATGTVLELARVNGTDRWTISLPFISTAAPRVIPGTDSLIVIEARRQDGVDPGVYLVSAGTQAVRKLFTFSPQYGPPELTVSPDGRRLLYLTWESVPPQVLTMDVSARGGL